MGAYYKMQENEHISKRICYISTKKMIASKDQEVMVNEIFEMMEDILRYLEDEEDEDYETK